MKVFDSLNKLVFGTPEQQLRKFTRGICTAMMIGTSSFENFYQKKGLKMRFYSDYAAQALTRRPGWKEIETNYFQHNSGLYLNIKNSHSLADVCILVVLTEFEATIGVGKVLEDTRWVVLDECKKVFGGYPEEKIESDLLDWKKINHQLLNY